jgi:hypothetical protein
VTREARKRVLKYFIVVKVSDYLSD